MECQRAAHALTKEASLLRRLLVRLTLEPRGIEGAVHASTRAQASATQAVSRPLLQAPGVSVAGPRSGAGCTPPSAPPAGSTAAAQSPAAPAPAGPQG